MRVTYYGQACILIEAGGIKLLTDPWLTEGAYLGTWFHTHILAEAGVTPATFPKDIDYLFISHEHLDHMDAETLRHFSPATPVLICKFSTPKFRHHLAGLGFTDIRECAPGAEMQLSGDVKATIFATAEYTNDSAILVEHNGVRVFNETDCKLGYSDLEALGEKGIDLGFYMFSGANWYPMLYDYPEDVQLDLVRRRRRGLLRSLVQRVKLTKPRFAVPAAGPCTVLHPDLLWLNSETKGIFIDPTIAVNALREGGVSAQPLNMAATDAWTETSGYERNAPDAFRESRLAYLDEAAARMTPGILARQTAEPPANAELSTLLLRYFSSLVAAQTPAVRERIAAKLALEVKGPRGGDWTIDFQNNGTDYVQEGIRPDWTYKITIEDKLISPFVTGEEAFFEDLLLSLRFRAARRPDEYNEPLYHFLYDPDPEKLHNWYATH